MENNVIDINTRRAKDNQKIDDDEKRYSLTLKGTICVGLMDLVPKEKLNEITDKVFDTIKNYAERSAANIGPGFPAIIFLPDGGGSFDVVRSSIKGVKDK